MTRLPLSSHQDLNVPPELLEWCQNGSGLILLAGINGSGKNATLASLVRYMGERDSDHSIQVLNGNSEYQYTVPGSGVFDNPVSDKKKFKHALQTALRADPHVLVADNASTEKEFKAFLPVADTGYLALATVHAQCCAQAIQRILILVDDDRYGLNVIAQAGIGVMAQVNVPTVNSSKHMTVYETMEVDEEVADLLLNHDIVGIERYQDTRKQSMEHQLVRAVLNKDVSCETAYKAARRAEAFKRILEEQDV